MSAQGTKTGQGRLAGKVAVITGASRGIGRVMALTLAREGAKIVVAAKSETERPHLPGSIHTVAAEIEAAGSEALSRSTSASPSRSRRWSPRRSSASVASTSSSTTPARCGGWTSPTRRSGASI